MDHYQQAIQLSPSHHVAVVNLGRLYRSLGENSMAEEWYRRYGSSSLLSWPPGAISSFTGFLVAGTDRLSEQEHMLPVQVTEQRGRVVMCSQHLPQLLRPQCLSRLGGGEDFLP